MRKLQSSDTTPVSDEPRSWLITYLNLHLTAEVTDECLKIQLVNNEWIRDWIQTQRKRLLQTACSVKKHQS